MNADEPLRPYGSYGDDEYEHAGGSATHLVDYWHVVSRRLWLVLLIFAVTTASAVWAVSRQRTFYRASVALQVNDPLQRTRGLTPGTRVSAQEIFIDPIQSEIEVLKSTPVAARVVDSLGLRLMPSSGDRTRSSLIRDVRVSPDAANGSYVLAYADDGSRAEFRTWDGEVLGSAPVGDTLEAGIARFTVQPRPGEEREYGMQIIPENQAANLVKRQIAASARESTNILDATYTSADPVLAPKVLNAAATALREQGARRVRVSAAQEVEFIEQRLDSARVQLTRSLEAIQDFKQSQAFTNLSAEEKELVNQSQELGKRLEALEAERNLFRGILEDLRRKGIEEMDLAQAASQIDAPTTSSIAEYVNRLQELREERRQLTTAGRRAPGHPQVQAIDEQIREVKEELVDAIEAHVQVLGRRLQSVSRQLADLRERQRAFPRLENELQRLELQRSIDQEMHQYLLSQLAQSQITRAAASPYVDVIDPAVGARPIGPRGRMNVLLGALLGLILGVGAAFFLEYLDRTIRTSTDVETLLGIPVLGVIPRLRRLEVDEKPRSGLAKDLPLIVALDPMDPAAEAYRNLRMNLTFMSTEEQPVRSLTFTSPGPDEGKSTTAMNFAVMLAQQGQRVLLIDADLRRPILHRALDLLREPGLTNLLVGDAQPREAVRPNVLPNLDILPSGPFPPNPSELLNSKTMRRLLEEFESKYDAVIVDSPPVLAVTDASVLGSQTDGLVLVLRSGETEQRGAERAVDQLRRIGVRIVGAVLNEVSATSSDESYYLQYYYSYSGDEEGSGGRLREGLEKVRFW